MVTFEYWISCKCRIVRTLVVDFFNIEFGQKVTFCSIQLKGNVKINMVTESEMADMPQCKIFLN